jgi:hypothetical protein
VAPDLLWLPGVRFLVPVIAFVCLGFLRPADAQILAFGAKGGVRATTDVSGSPPVSNESQRYIVGPAVELRLPLGFAVEFDALYRRFGYAQSSSSCCTIGTTRERANSWEFPIIAKYRFSERGLHPFLGVGYDPRTVQGTDFSSGVYNLGLPGGPQYFSGQTSTAYAVTHGLVVSGGFDLGVRHLRISPELRYVHWTQPFWNQYGPDGHRIQSGQNEVFVLFGLMWR